MDILVFSSQKSLFFCFFFTLKISFFVALISFSCFFNDLFNPFLTFEFFFICLSIELICFWILFKLLLASSVSPAKRANDEMLNTIMSSAFWIFLNNFKCSTTLYIIEGGTAFTVFGVSWLPFQNLFPKISILHFIISLLCGHLSRIEGIYFKWPRSNAHFHVRFLIA